MIKFWFTFIALAPIQLEAQPKNIDKIGNVSKDNDTGVEFPNVINVFDDNSKILSLIGLGVRTVSFLKIRVYSLGIYADDNAINDLKGIDNIKEKLTNVKNEELTTESIMNNVINSNTVFAVRIVPVRNTDFGHLRDGFIRAIQARMKLLKVSDETANDINISLQSFKTFFPPSKVPKGDDLTLIKTHNKDLILSYNGKTLGKLDSNSPGVEFISTQLLLAYFADKNPISAKAKQNVIDNL